MNPLIIVERSLPLLRLALLAATGTAAFVLTRKVLRRQAEKERPVRWAERVELQPSLGAPDRPRGRARR